jgi:hypothetical protein
MMSETITSQNVASLEFRLRWRSSHAAHQDVLFAGKVNFWSDLFPPLLYDSLTGGAAGEEFFFTSREVSLTPPFDPDNEFPVEQQQFDRRFAYPASIEPRLGRFYPKGILKAIPNVFKSNIEPFRCTGLDEKSLTVDFNHPMARHEATLAVRVVEVRRKPGEIGGSCTSWVEAATDGPGMQARSRGMPTDFFSDGAFQREDERPDRYFYDTPRLVTHIDEQASSVISGIYGQLLSDGMVVLDLMSSWRSHVPPDIKLRNLVGIGLNEEELRENPQLTRYLIHDLNREPRLPFGSNAFNAVICTVSIEYLTRPFEVFDEIARVLAPGGVCIMTFSNRWFPPKVVRIWGEINEFERMGLVSEYFLRSGKFNGIETCSMRGLPRPEDDRYFPQFMTSDPVYAVWGKNVVD